MIHNLAVQLHPVIGDDRYTNADCSVEADTEAEVRAVMDDFLSRGRGDRKAIEYCPSVWQEPGSPRWRGTTGFLRTNTEAGDLLPPLFGRPGGYKCGFREGVFR